MKRITFLIVFLTVSLAALTAQGFTGSSSGSGNGGGFTGPGSTPNLVTVVEAGKLRDDTRVLLQGSIIRALGDEMYIFKDATGEIMVEIDREVWRGLSVSETDTVEIRGEVEQEWARTEIDVKSIKKL